MLNEIEWNKPKHSIKKWFLSGKMRGKEKETGLGLLNSSLLYYASAVRNKQVQFK